MSGIRSSGTAPERQLLRVLRRLLGNRVRMDFNCHFLPGKPDVLIGSLRLAIFADGCFFHCCPKHGHVPQSNQHYWVPKLEGNCKRDANERRKLRSLGLAVWRFWEHDFRTRTIERTCRALKARLNRRRAKLRVQDVR